MMKLVLGYLAMVSVLMLIVVLGNETLIMLSIVCVVVLMAGIVVIGWPPRPPRRVAAYRKDDLDWPDDPPMIEAEWRPVDVCDLLVGPASGLKDGV